MLVSGRVLDFETCPNGAQLWWFGWKNTPPGTQACFISEKKDYIESYCRGWHLSLNRVESAISTQVDESQQKYCCTHNISPSPWKQREIPIEDRTLPCCRTYVAFREHNRLLEHLLYEVSEDSEAYTKCTPPFVSQTFSLKINQI